uniref:ROK family protein n=1 Tax=candidate division WOR-3 bacterium TaxID=2052148 RepID=A0A7V3RFW7_UNCW3
MSYYIGVDVGGTNIKAGIVYKDSVIKRINLKTQADRGPEECLNQIRRAIKNFINEGEGIGIGIAGIIDSKKGIVRYSPNLIGWEDIRLVSILKKDFKKPVRILNDVNAILIGEWIYGAGKGYKNIFLFTLGTGVGGAGVCEGRLLFGANGFAGEFGHTVINFSGPKCLCGNYGCLERYVGSRYIIELAHNKIKKERTSLSNYKNLTPKIIADEAKKGDRIAIEIFEEVGYYIGIGVANIVNLFDPEVVIISGGISRAGKILFEPIKRTVRQRILGPQYRRLKIVPAKLGDEAGILGSAFFVANLDL